MDVPLYYTLAYFGSGYLVLSFARRVSQVFQAVFSALFSSSPVSVSLQPLAGFPSASRPVQFAPTWWDPSHCFGKRRKKNPIPSAGSVYDDLFLFLHAFTPLITFGFNSYFVSLCLLCQFVLTVSNS